MRIVHLSTNADRGGAARAMLRLHLSLREAGADSTVLSINSISEWPGVKCVTINRSSWARLRRKLFSKLGRGRVRAPSPQHDAFSDERAPYGPEVIAQLEADVVHIHWVTGMIDPAELLKRTRIPLVWTIHDMNPFTGGCHFTEGCGRFTRRCGNCPQLPTHTENDIAAAIQSRKLRAFSNLPKERLHLVTPSAWMAAQIGQSAILGKFPTLIIPYGVDVERMRPVGRATARQALGISQSARVILVCADYSTPRKGFLPLQACLARLDKTLETLVLSVGEGFPCDGWPIKHHGLGKVNDDSRLALAFSAADVFAIPSLEDNLPNTILESLACGTPAVGFSAGGIPEAIGEAGCVVPVGDTAALAQTLNRLLGDASLLAALTAAARPRAERHFSLGLQASRYLELYDRVANRRKTCAPAVIS